MVHPNKWFMTLHNLKQSGFIDFSVTDVADGPRHDETWVSSIFFTRVAPGYMPIAGNVYSSTYAHKTKAAAREEASYTALTALGLYLQ